MHLVGFIVRIYDNARSPERQIHLPMSAPFNGPSVRRHGGAEKDLEELLATG